MNIEPLHRSVHLGAVLVPVADLLLRLGLSVRVIMRLRQYGVTLAWLVVILILPFLGAVIYLFFGGNRIGDTRAKHAQDSLTTIYASQKNITLTTPYFVPDKSILTALQSAAQRTVNVRIIVPERNDSKLVHYARWARYESMIKSGVSIKLFTGGLLHSKTITVDDEFALSGSVNIDMRSFWLNFKATLFIYKHNFTRVLRETQERYVENSKNLELKDFADRSLMQRFFENSALIIRPLL